MTQTFQRTSQIFLMALLLLVPPAFAETEDGGEASQSSTAADAVSEEPAKTFLGGREFLAECSLLMNDGEQVTLDTKRESDFLKDFRTEINKRIIGQEPAVDAMAQVMEMIEAMMFDPEKPMGTFLFVGPTGVGKTELAKQVVKFFGGNTDEHMIRIDGGEMQQKHETARLTGAPQGYAGYGEPARLHPDNIAAAKLKFTFPDGSVIEFVIILIDEIEKASEDFQKLLLGMLDNGKVTMGDNTPSYTRKAIILGTSNEGAKEVEKLIDQRKLRNEIKQQFFEKLKQDPEFDGRIMGLTKEDLGIDTDHLELTPEEQDLTGRVDLEFREQIKNTYLQAIKDSEKFAPEWINRWDGIIQFLHLGDEEFLQISDIFLALAQKRIFERGKVKVGMTVTDEAKKWIVDQGTDFKNGARELKRTINDKVTRVIARMTTTGELIEGDIVELSVKDGQLVFNRISSRQAMAGMDKETKRQTLLKFADAEFPGFKFLETEFDPKQEDDAIVEKTEVAKSLATELDNNSLAALSLYNDALRKMGLEHTPNVMTAEIAQQMGGGVNTARPMYIQIGRNIYRITAYYEEDPLTGQQKAGSEKVDVILSSNGLPPAEFVRNLWGNGRLVKYSIDDVERLLENTKGQGPDYSTGSGAGE